MVVLELHLLVLDPLLQSWSRRPACHIPIIVRSPICERRRLPRPHHLCLHLQLEQPLAFNVGRIGRHKPSPDVELGWSQTGVIECADRVVNGVEGLGERRQPRQQRAGGVEMAFLGGLYRT